MLYKQTKVGEFNEGLFYTDGDDLLKTGVIENEIINVGGNYCRIFDNETSI